MNIKSALIAALSISLLFITQTAHADFRKALDAYQARDGATLLKEVKDAVDKRNDDGLILFLNATALDSLTSDYNEVTYESKSTLRAILIKNQWDKLRKLLLKATDKNANAQYYLVAHSQFRKDFLYQRYPNENPSQSTSANKKKNITVPLRKFTDIELSKQSQKVNDDYVARGSRMAILLNSTLTNKAEVGDPISQLSLGLKYLNVGKDIVSGSYYGCSYLSKESICQVKDEAKGYYWLKRATKTYVTGNYDSFSLFANETCKALYTNSNDEIGKLKQAYLWAIMGINEHPLSGVSGCLDELKHSGLLKLVAPQVDEAWEDPEKLNALIYQNELLELPVWIKEINNELAREELPLFQYQFSSFPVHSLEVYSDGRVLYGSIYGFEKGLLTRVSPKAVQKFLAELDKLGFYQWGVNTSDDLVCDKSSPYVSMQINVRNLASYSRKYFGVCNFDSSTAKTKVAAKRISMVYALVEKYFPTVNLRLKVGNSARIAQKLLVREGQLSDIIKKGELNGN